MDKLQDKIETTNNNLPFQYHKHQVEAFNCLNELDKNLDSFSTLLVLPTGGGKTITASSWLLKNAINKGKKVLWIAHRTSLLDQAFYSFKKCSVTENLPRIPIYNVRIVSGDKEHHDYACNIQKDDQLLIISKDSLRRNLSELDRWLEDELYFVVDEAHHSTATTYRKIIEYVKARVPKLKLIGLTATPTRTADNEKGLLAKIYTDGIDPNTKQVVKNDIGIAYKVDLNNLIAQRILSKPVQITKATHEDYGKQIGLDALSKINMDILPEDIQEAIAKNQGRNKLIVETYKENQDVYKKTIVFAVNVLHAIELNKTFSLYGIESDYVVSNVKDEATGCNRRPEENARAIEKYRKGEINVLINVNILTEGVDFPDTQTVFLTRPTISTIFMTQMVGRALRGPAAGGTENAYIVSFFDNWDNKIAWVNPATIFEYESNFEDKEPNDNLKRNIRYVAISKIEEFVEMLQNHIELTEFDTIPFIERIPFGMYLFTYDVNTQNEDCVDKSCQIMVYGNKESNYKNMMDNLPNLFAVNSNSDDDTLSENILNQMIEQCCVRFFSGVNLYDYEKEGIKDILCYYKQKEVAPNYYPFEDDEREQLDVSKIAQELVDKDLRDSEEEEFLDAIWEDTDKELLRLFFINQRYFNRSVSIEMEKIKHPDWYLPKEDNVVWRNKKPEDMSMNELRRYHPKLYIDYRTTVFAEAKKTAEDLYMCKLCGQSFKARMMQIDHIKSLNKGGKTELSNLQLLCRSCNGLKSDK